MFAQKRTHDRTPDYQRGSSAIYEGLMHVARWIPDKYRGDFSEIARDIIAKISEIDIEVSAKHQSRIMSLQEEASFLGYDVVKFGGHGTEVSLEVDEFGDR